MLYVYFGSDTLTVRQKAIDFLETLKEDNTQVTHVTSDTYASGMLLDHAEGASLFGTKGIVVLDTLSDDELIFEEVLQNLEVLKRSPNDFLVIEQTLTASYKKKYTEYAERIEEITGGGVEKFNTFSLTDAFMRKDRKTLWLLLMEAWKEGVTNEAIIGVLLWQVKMLRLVQKTKSAEEAEQKPFVYGKAKKALSNFKEGELEEISRTLLSIYHDGHQGIVDIPLALEKWVLTLR